jgi:imidazolonepropionase-like amidohydrolase
MPTPRPPTGIRTRSGWFIIERSIFRRETIELMSAGLVVPAHRASTRSRQGQLPPEIVEKAEQVLEIHRRAFRRAVEAGVRIAMGTDSGVTPHGRNLRELELMVEGGMTPAAALAATTSSAAELMGLDDRLGTLEPGKLADLVVWTAIPTASATWPGASAGLKAGSRVVPAA